MAFQRLFFSCTTFVLTRAHTNARVPMDFSSTALDVLEWRIMKAGDSLSNDDQSLKEQRQKNHYLLNSELQNMARELPMKFQQRLPYDLLSGLANALLDGTVFEIVRSLEEVQHLEEKSLFNQRSKLNSEHKAQRHEMQKKHKEMLQSCQTKPHNLPLVQSQIQRELETMTKRCDEELKKKDMKVILDLDQKVMDQQVMLEKAGVPGFFVTNNRQEIRLQMYLLEFILRLSRMNIPLC